MTNDLAALDRTVATLDKRLLEYRTPSGHWEGHLASSALSTATAIVALAFAERASNQNHGSLIDAGFEWLIANQNDDGGWGDTVISLTNLSTTLLCWSALSLGVDKHEYANPAIQRAERWLRSELGDLSAEHLKDSVVKRYGKDLTFSVPILAVLALTGRLGSPGKAWRLVPQLPFELAAFPHQWFRRMRLPVVSYALPALVAIGQVRHHRAPTRNPLLRPIRSALRSRTLEIARRMQPQSGGYLEAVPLTAFVVMSLIDSGAASHPVVTSGLRFLVNSARSDGSWPIDTNLATWVTTLSVKALAAGDGLLPGDRQRILKWLLDQQVREEHPFTHAQPGGWAWTSLTGSVPDADDTSGALVAIWNLDGPRQVHAAIGAIRWLLEIQNTDGGIPTFCRGWGALPFDRSAPDLTAHALEAWSAWHSVLPSDLQRPVSKAAERAVAYLVRHQQADGSWLPLWFGNEHVVEENNPTYGTARVVSGLASTLAIKSRAGQDARQRGLTWLLKAQNPAGFWGGAAGAPPSIEETGVALDALAACATSEAPQDLKDAMRRGVQWLVAATGEGLQTPPAPIGLYFARLWYYEELYPLVFALRGLRNAMRVLLSLGT